MRNILICISLVLLFGPVSAQPATGIDEFEGQVVLLDFWASWCVPCRRSFPWMNEMQQKYADDGLIIVAINLDNDLDDAAKFLREYPADFKIVYDTDRSLAREYDVQAMPSSFLIGRDGEPIESHLGFKVKQQPEYEAAIREALGQNSTSEQE